MTFFLDFLYLTELLLFLCFYVKYNEISKSIIFLIITESTILIFNIFGMVLLYIFKFENNLFVFHFLAPIQFIFSLLTLYFNFEGKKAKLILRLIVILIPSLNIFFSIYIEEISKYNSYVLSINNFFIGNISLYLLIQIYINDFVDEFKTFWLSVGFITNSFGLFFIQGFMNYLINLSNKTAYNMYLGEMFVCIISTFILLIPVLLEKRKLDLLLKQQLINKNELSKPT
jgi:hypothetical protein